MEQDPQQDRPQSDLKPGDDENTGPWYRGITRYQWTVLLIASLGWVFDIFEGQIFVASMRDAIPSLVPPGTSVGTIQDYNNRALAAFLLGGALGGVLFGMLSDRIGRKRTMTLTILMYSLFTCVSAFSQEWWHLVVFRFLVAMGVGGEWAVASAFVAEVFPKRARAWSLGIFHASSVFGTYLAIAVGTFVIGSPAVTRLAEESGMPSLRWRIGFAIGVLPAFLIIWVRRSLHEPESWEEARTAAKNDKQQKMGNVFELFSRALVVKTLVGLFLAAVGLATFWGAHIYGKDILYKNVLASYREEVFPQHQRPGPTLLAVFDGEAAVEVNGDPVPLRRDDGTYDLSAIENGLRNTDTALLAPYDPVLKRWEMLGMFLVTTGGGLGLLSFGPLCERIGRRGAFLAFHIGGLVAALATFQLLEERTVILAVLPIFGFLTLGMHAGYAIYFPELFPTRLRGTGGGFCFNMGRILAAPILILSGIMQRQWGYTLEGAATTLSWLFLLGVIALLFAPETKDQDLLD